jgi:hypothetical protein
MAGKLVRLSVPSLGCSFRISQRSSEVADYTDKAHEDHPHALASRYKITPVP